MGLEKLEERSGDVLLWSAGLKAASTGAWGARAAVQGDTEQRDG